jgi:uracil-DNA glycosylase
MRTRRVWQGRFVTSRLRSLIEEANACTHCAAQLPHGPRPVFRVHRESRVLLIGQAPGAKVHASGAPWDDASGDHLREWLGVERATFDDPRLFAIMPMGFCFPGRRKGGDLPPRPECAPKWHQPLRALLPRVELTLLIGQYAQDHYLQTRDSLTETVRNFEAYLPTDLPLPHPSWRSKLWMKKNPWFERELLPVLRARIAATVRA